MKIEINIVTSFFGEKPLWAPEDLDSTKVILVNDKITFSQIKETFVGLYEKQS